MSNEKSTDDGNHVIKTKQTETFTDDGDRIITVQTNTTKKNWPYTVSINFHKTVRYNEGQIIDFEAEQEKMFDWDWDSDKDSDNSMIYKSIAVTAGVAGLYLLATRGRSLGPVRQLFRGNSGTGTPLKNISQVEDKII